MKETVFGGLFFCLLGLDISMTLCYNRVENTGNDERTRKGKAFGQSLFIGLDIPVFLCYNMGDMRKDDVFYILQALDEPGAQLAIAFQGWSLVATITASYGEVAGAETEADWDLLVAALEESCAAFFDRNE